MRRREFIAAALGAVGLDRLQPAVAAPNKPDIVVIVTDDMRDSDWQALPETRKWIEQEGTFFPNFILPTPICAPSRASVLTGMYAHNHRVLDNEGSSSGWKAFHRRHLDSQTIAVALQGAGYRTGMIGKYLNGFPNSGHKPTGWTSFVATSELAYYNFSLNENGQSRTYQGKKNYSTDVLANEAVKFIGAGDASTPLFLYFTPKAPHGPATPARSAKNLYAGASADHDPSFNEADVSDKPKNVRQKHLLGGKQINRLDKLERKRLETLDSVDKAISAIRDALKARGTLGNAGFFVLSDNGYQMGQHREVKKDQPYRGSTQVTMGAVGPGIASGKTDRRLVANIDIPFTVAQLAGVSLPGGDGRSILASNDRTGLVIETFRHSSFTGLRTPRYLYVEDPGGERELYDYQNDPWELDNLLADWDGHTPTQASLDLGQTLAVRLSQMKDCAGDRCRSLDTAPL